MTFRNAHRPVALLVAALLASAPAWADKPEWAGKGKHEKSEKHGGHGDHEQGGKHGGQGRREEVRVGAYFNDQQRSSVRQYYAQQYGNGRHCPPGLAKKNNGCMPPGQARKWAVGQPLPSGVTVYTVPQQVVVQLPPVPVGYKYVRVASDILLIAAGSQMVVDGITGLLGN